ncbi:MAG: DEAD/DEAH box helicase [Clostridia bacterium]|nr:DEAD/DEAH box helicase [Clostridia bacterium]
MDISKITFKYQQNTIDKAIKYFENSKVSYPKFNIFYKMGLGKTITSLGIAAKLQPKTILIVCPKSLIDMWVYNFNKFITGYMRISEAKAVNNYTTNIVVFTNYESLLSLTQPIFPDLCIFDEVHKIKNINGKIHKNINRYIMPNRTLCLTGTPIVKDLMDLFGILTCVGEQTFGHLNASQFKYKYVINGGVRSTAQLKQIIEPFTVDIDYEGLVDMPDTEDIIIPVPISVKQQFELEDIYSSNKNALVRITEAIQVTSGIPDSPKVKLCESLIDDIVADNQKVVLFVRLDKEFEYFTNKYKDICASINGKTKDRETQVQEFQSNPKIKLFIGNIQTAGVGLTLTAAHKCIFFSETYSWGDLTQAMSRIYRIGQEHSCSYYHLLCLGTIDEFIYKNIQMKNNLIEEFKKCYGGD